VASNKQRSLVMAFHNLTVAVNYVISRLLVFLTPESSSEMRDAAITFYVQQGYITPDYPRYVAFFAK
jgi:hypothetical protein